MTGRIRAYRVDDVEAVIGLHRDTLLTGHEPGPEFTSYQSAFYGGTLFDHPWHDDELTSLVYEDGDGRVVGFVGVIPRPMVLDDRPVRVAVSVRFMVDPDHPHRALAAAALHRRFLHGPQDLSIVENANDAARRVWQGTRQATVLGTGSISWSIPAAPIPEAEQPGRPHELATDELLELIDDGSAGHRLRPRYDEKSLRWLVEFLRDAGYRGALHAHAVRAPGGRLLGWYVYYRNPAGYNGVMQLVWKDDPAPVLGALLAHAASSGVPTRGRLQDGLLPHVAAQGCELSPGPWTVVHSPDPRIHAAFRCGAVFLTRLEGEFC